MQVYMSIILLSWRLLLVAWKIAELVPYALQVMEAQSQGAGGEKAAEGMAGDPNFVIGGSSDTLILELSRPLALPPEQMLGRKCMGPAWFQVQGPGPDFLFNIDPGGCPSGPLHSEIGKPMSHQ